MENKTFQFGDSNLSVVMSEDKTPYFVAKDVCDILEIKNVSQAIQQLDDDEKLPYVLDRGGQNRNVNLISESGLYSLVLRSNKPESKVFKKWITSEVLPSIRKHGAYMTDTTVEAMLTNPDLLIGLATQLKEERLEKDRLKLVTDYQSNELKIQAPKVEYHDRVLQSEALIATNVIAKEMELSAVSLNKLLHNKGIIYKSQNTWVLYSKFQDKGLTGPKTIHYRDSLGREMTTVHTYWTEKGRKFIHELLKPQNTQN